MRVALVRDGDKHPHTQHHHIGTEACCRKCGRVWTSVQQCHCTVCHRQFGGVVAFEKHRQRGVCLSDRSLGRRKLSKTEGKHGWVWGRSFAASVDK